MPENQSFLQELEGRSQIFTFCQVPKPDFWFSESVDFRWTDEDDSKHYSETGEIIGIAWNFLENEWEYRVIWLSSTTYADANYPYCDNHFVTAEVLCRP